MFIRSITTFVPNLKTARPEKKKKNVYPLFVIFFHLRFASFFLVNSWETGRPKLLNELPKIANWYLSTSSIIGGRRRRIVCPSSISATWQVRQMGVLLYFLGRFMCGEWMYVSSLKMDGKTCMLQLQLRQARMQTVLVWHSKSGHYFFFFKFKLKPSIRLKTSVWIDSSDFPPRRDRLLMKALVAMRFFVEELLGL